MARDCRAAVAATTQRAPLANQRVVTYFKCSRQGHYKSNYPKLKNQNRGNKEANKDAHGRAYALGRGDGNPDSNILTRILLSWPMKGLPDSTLLLGVYHAVIVCDEKIVRIPYGNEILTIRGDGSNYGSNSILNIISCTKTQKYIKKGCHVFLAQDSAMKTEDKLEEERLKEC
nr:reverse transcriptase domain-containing protein [Tanacetum cinerariifolium]